MIKNALRNENFLKELFRSKIREKYVKITSLNLEEEPLEEIQGRVISGTVNVDGSSAIRRSCNLEMIAEDQSVTDYYWTFKNKFKLEVGLKNYIDKDYDDIIWFKMGIFVINSFSATKDTKSFKISISGQDKMCLLNGSLGGSITAHAVKFHEVEEWDEDAEDYVKRKPLISEIIFDLLTIHGGELEKNVYIDVDKYGLCLMEYRGDNPIYINKSATGLSVSYVSSGLSSEKFEYGETVGYTVTDLVYPEDLIANPGDSIVSVLDKIKNKFTNYEYFYDINGRFRFQPKRTYENNSWSPLVTDKEDGTQYVDTFGSDIAFSFDDSFLISSYNNSPKLDSLKNDYSVWGERTSLDGSKRPIHYRFAIDTKPTNYRTIVVDDTDFEKANKRFPNAHLKKENFVNLFPKTYVASKTCDWREIIYQMASDYYKYSRYLDDFQGRVARWNSSEYPTGKTGYEQYYVDIYNFWREIYDPTATDKTYVEDDYSLKDLENSVVKDVFSKVDSSQWDSFSNTLKNANDTITNIIKHWVGFEETKEYQPEVPAARMMMQSRSLPIISNSFANNLYNGIKNVYEKFTEDYNKVNEENKAGYVSWLKTLDFGVFKDFLKNKISFENNDIDFPEFKQIQDTALNIDYENQEQLNELNTWSYALKEKLSKFTELCSKYLSGQNLYAYSDGFTDPVVQLSNIEKWFLESGKNIILSLGNLFKNKIIKEVEGEEEETYYKGDGFRYLNLNNFFIKNFLNDECCFYNTDGETPLFDISGSFYQNFLNILVIDKGLNPEELLKNTQVTFQDIEYTLYDYLNLILDRQNENEIYGYYKSGNSYYPFKNFTSLNGEDKNSIQINEETTGGEPGEIAPIPLFFQDSEVDIYVLSNEMQMIKNLDRDIVKNFYYTNGITLNSELNHRYYDCNGVPIVNTSYVTPLRYYSYHYAFNLEDSNWCKAAIAAPQNLNFWFDFLEGEEEISKYSVKKIGPRAYSKKETDVKSVFYNSIPEIIYYQPSDDIHQQQMQFTGYDWNLMQPNFFDALSVSAIGKTAKDRLDELLYEHLYCSESITINCLPIYNLEPNTKISLYDKESGINGEYNLSSMSFPLDTKGTMSITAVKHVKSLY